MVEWQSVLEAEQSHDGGSGLLRSLVELSAGQRGGDWEVVEDEGRFLLKSARWLQEPQTSARRAGGRKTSWTPFSV
jgi:hypothetical protein